MSTPRATPAARSRKASGSAAKPRAAAPAEQPGEDALPDEATVAALLLHATTLWNTPRLAHTRAALLRLATAPPQVLLFEGGTAEERLNTANIWAALTNCPSASPHNGQGPCLECPVCVRCITHLHRDIFFLDGAAASIKIDDVREVRAVLGEPPREATRRVIILHEAQALVEAAANALLKSLEEPRPATSFLLLAPQRERLLPTLVSRSMVVTLPWPKAEHSAAALREELALWEAALCQFMLTGQGLFSLTSTKGSVTPALVNNITNLCRHALVGCMHALHTGNSAKEGLEALFARLPAPRLRMVDEILAECQESLVYMANPAIVLEWLATRLYLLLPR